MGAIRRNRDGTVVLLPNQLIVGRGDACDLRLGVPSVSATHAMLRWRGLEWVLGDLGSRNGTYLNGRRLDATRRGSLLLRAGDEIAFAEREEAWTVVDVGPPRPFLVPDDGSPPIPLSESELLPLPATVGAHGYLFCESSVWKYEDVGGQVATVRAGEPLRVGGVAFRLHLPGPAAETPLVLSPMVDRALEEVSLDIHVSSDEETAAVTAISGEDRLELPARAHLYLLAHLARQRLAGAEASAQGEEGWISVDEACRDLALPTAEALAVSVFRCRKDFETLGIREATRLVDRAKRGLLRIGIPAERLRVEHG
jgi:pSer/pThr/pTyr-binding forkhead associated (FHA) protein